MPKQNQILAIEKSIKQHAEKDLTKAHHGLAKNDLLKGISRVYRSLDDDGEQYPPEDQRVQVRVPEVIKHTEEILTGMFDIVATKDWTNCKARADIVVDHGTEHEVLLVEQAPATYLLWLEKQLNDMYTFVSKLPVLPASEKWEWDEQQNCYRSQSFETAKKKKVAHPFIKYEATKEHPAQVETVMEDVLQGYWKTTSYSGALPAQRVQELKTRVEKLQKAVKFARERANSVDAEEVKVAEKVLGYLFGE